MPSASRAARNIIPASSSAAVVPTTAIGSITREEKRHSLARARDENMLRNIGCGCYDPVNIFRVWKWLLARTKVKRKSLPDGLRFSLQRWQAVRIARRGIL